MVYYRISYMVSAASRRQTATKVAVCSRCTHSNISILCSCVRWKGLGYLRLGSVGKEDPSSGVQTSKYARTVKAASVWILLGLGLRLSAQKEVGCGGISVSWGSARCAIGLQLGFGKLGWREGHVRGFKF